MELAYYYLSKFFSLVIFFESEFIISIPRLEIDLGLFPLDLNPSLFL